MTSNRPKSRERRALESAVSLGAAIAMLLTGCSKSKNPIEAGGCASAPSPLDFKTAVIGHPADQTLRVTNNGAGSITVGVTSSGPPFSVVGNAGFNLGKAQSATVTVRFSPTEVNEFAGKLSLGGSCDSVVAHGIGVVEAFPPFAFDWGGYGSTPELFTVGPSFVATNAGGDVYAVDESRAQIKRFTSTGAFVTAWGSVGSADGQFQELSGIAVGRSGNVYAIDAGNRRVQKFSNSGTFLAKWGSSGTGDGQFLTPNDLAVDDAENVYVLDVSLNQVKKFTSTGSFVTKWGSQGSGDGQFEAPDRIAADAAGNVYVTETASTIARVQKFASNGAFVTKWGTFGSGLLQLSDLSDVATDRQGNVYLLDGLGSFGINPIGVAVVKKYSSAGTLLTLGADQRGSSDVGTCLAIADDGSVYVGVKNSAKILKFGP